MPLRPRANALDTAKVVSEALKGYAKNFPAGIRYSHPSRHDAVRAGIGQGSVSTLYEAGVLVLLVIMVFLQDWRATLVPATTVPVTIVGAFAGMAVLGSASTC